MTTGKRKAQGSAQARKRMKKSRAMQRRWKSAQQAAESQEKRREQEDGQGRPGA